MRKGTSTTSLRMVARVILVMASCVTIAVGFVRIGISQAPSGIFLRSTATASTNLGGGNSLTLGQPTSMAAGDILIAQLAVRGGTDLTLTAPSGWTLIQRENYDGSIAQ